MEQLKGKRSPAQDNTFLMTGVSLLLAIQLLIITVLIFSFIPIKLNDFVKTLLPLYWDQVRPEREMMFYVLFISYGVALQLGGMWLLRKRLNETALTSALKWLLAGECFWTLLQVFAVFKIIILGGPQWARGLLYMAILGAVLSKIFWPECLRWIKAQYVRLADAASFSRGWVWGADMMMPILLFVLLYTPDMPKVLAHVFSWDYFFHLDALVMSPGWAYLNGMTINIDTNSNYSVLIPVLWSRIAQVLGSFSYEHVMQGLILGGIIYYVGFYFLLRSWTKSVLLAVFGVLLAVKLQMFHWGIWPIAWRYPSATPIRHFIDLLPLFFVAQHALRQDKRMLWLASLACGLLLAYSLEVGIYAAVAFSAYIIFLLWVPHTRNILYQNLTDVRPLLGLLAMPWVIGLAVLWAVQGPTVFSGLFWTNTMEFSRLFLNGWAALPFTDGLKDKQYFAFIMGFIIPAVYALTVMIIGALSHFNRIHLRNSYMIFVCIYGLGLYHYFIYRSGVTSYYAVVIPFVMVLCFWVMKLTSLLELRVRRLCLGALAGGTLVTLMTSFLFTAYPNALNLAGVDLTQARKAYQLSFDVGKDAAFIQRLSTEDERVALISSQETRLLMEAHRKPFFYYFPLVHSVPLNSNAFKAIDLITVDRMRRTLNQLEEQKPARVFIEKKLFLGQLPPEYYKHFQALTTLLQYLQTHYESEGNGFYLMSLKRKVVS